MGDLPVKCQTCQADGEQSFVRVGSSATTAMGTDVFYDEDGRFHCHDPNTTATEFWCSRGHSWTESRQHRCLTCSEATP